MNIDDVARRAQVSTATVSRVLNGTARVAPEPLERVRQAMASMNYLPNTNARALGSGRSTLYGLIISDITNPCFPELVKAFEDIAIEHRQDVIIANTNCEAGRMQNCVARMLQRKVAGVAIMAFEMQGRLLEDLNDTGLPVVVLDMPLGPRLHVVRVNYAAGVSLAMQHLFDMGHENVAFIGGRAGKGSTQTRQDALLCAFYAHGGDSRRVEEGDDRVEGGRHAMRRLLARRPGVSAVLASNDLMAIGAMNAIHEAGLRGVPEDISIVGFDDIELSAYAYPPLTTLHVPRSELAAAAFRSLYHRQSGPASIGRRKPASREHLVHPTLVVRQSTAPVRKH